MREYLDMNRYSDQVKQMAMQFYGLKFPSKTMWVHRPCGSIAFLYFFIRSYVDHNLRTGTSHLSRRAFHDGVL